MNIEALQSLAQIWTAADGAVADPMLTAEVAARVVLPEAGSGLSDTHFG
ncbi:hypothetical protein ACQP1O_09455 [Nocardia sp. CA-151230]